MRLTLDLHPNTPFERWLWLTARIMLGLAILAVALLAGIAAAQEAAPAAPVATGFTVDAALLIALKVLGLIVVAVLLPKVHAFIAAHEADKSAGAAKQELWTLIDKVEHFVEVGVAGVMPTLQADLAAQKSPKDIANDAADSAKKYLGAAGMGEIGDVLGLAGDALTKYLQDLAAKKVAAAQAAGAAAAATIKTGPDAVAAING
jgi:uncharacterized membrane protein (DUF485 family)